MKVKYFRYLSSAYYRYRRLWLFLFFLLALIASLLLYEIRTSRFQAAFFSAQAKKIKFLLKPGESSRIRFPEYGPHDIRLGYTRIPSIIKSFAREGFVVEAQAVISEFAAEIIDRGLFPIYREKTQAGLEILDRNGNSIYSVRRPENIYKAFSDIPEIIVQAILFIENREILDRRYPYKNPAVEWDRLARAVLDKFIQIFRPGHSAPGGSTIATQLEKYLHGYQGRTRNSRDKLQQMLSASFRAYLEGQDTIDVREKIVLNYINSIPLAALPGYGEVNGLSDGLQAWYSANLEDCNRRLRDYTYEKAAANPSEYAECFKKVLSLFIAHRRPSFFLLYDPKHLNNLTNEYLYIFEAYDVIPRALRDEALKTVLNLNKSAPPPSVASFIGRKATNAIRTRLLKLMRYRHLYDLDHVDVTVRSTLDFDANKAVSDTLMSLADKEVVKKLGLMGDRTLSKGDPKKVIYSVTLYERVGNANVLRVQTDNLDRPFDINEGTRLDLGSTAKLRVLANYLEIIAGLYEEYSRFDKPKLAKALKSKSDTLSAWVKQTVYSNPKITLSEILNAAMQRRYSASPGESFFTGGGLHTFSNFKREDNGRVVSVLESLRHSINLPFIRIMRDNLNYYKAQLSDDEESDADSKDSKRKKYLAKFADKEGSHFMYSFYGNYKGKSPSEVLGTFIKRMKPTPKRLAVVFRHIKPDKPLSDFKEFVEFHMPKANLSDKMLENLYEFNPPGKYSLNDQGYLISTHPLELWMVGYMVNHPGAQFSEILEQSREERQEVYQWLMKKDKRRAQDVRIRSLIEAEAFVEMHKDWKRLGYPFQSMVPSLASAIGNSGDRPAALAELMGIIVNDGVRYPMERMERLRFAEKTPFATILSLDKNNPGERVMNPEVAAVLRDALKDVVENGTARRVNKAFVDPEKKTIPVGGKTGTGDNRYETFGRGGNLLSSRVVNRTATFVFYIGDRFFGTVTAHVQGSEAAKYDFTSALAAELLKALVPALEPVILKSNAKNPETPEAKTSEAVAPVTATPINPDKKEVSAKTSEPAKKTEPVKTPAAAKPKEAVKAKPTAGRAPAVKKTSSPKPLPTRTPLPKLTNTPQPVQTATSVPAASPASVS